MVRPWCLLVWQGEEMYYRRNTNQFNSPTVHFPQTKKKPTISILSLLELSFSLWKLFIFSYLCIFKYNYFTIRQRISGKGNVFSHVSLSGHRGGGLHVTTHHIPRRLLSGRQNDSIHPAGRSLISATTGMSINSVIGTMNGRML